MLPLAFAYILDDCADDASLRSRWEAAVQNATAFVDRREWILLADAENIYFDDVVDRRFIPDTIELRTVTAGHLGNSAAEQRRAAEALSLPLLSSAVEMEWSGAGWRACRQRLGSSVRPSLRASAGRPRQRADGRRGRRDSGTWSYGTVRTLP